MTDDALENIRSISRKTRLLVAAIACAIGLLALYILVLAVFKPDGYDALAMHAFDGNVTITTPVRAAMLIIQGVGIALTFWILGCLWTVFSRFGDGAVFEISTGRAVRQAGFASLAMAFYLMLLPTLTSLLLTMNNPPGQREIAVAFSTQLVLAILMAGFFIVIGHVLTLGAAIDEDSRSIV